MSGLQNNFQPVVAEETTGTQFNGQRRQSGPLKEIVAQQDSLYKYISWEDPARTIGSYFAALGFLLAVHHLHLTQLALKFSAIGLGVMSLAEFAGRSFGPNNFVSRMRPKHYKTVPESTLNATLKDIHDFTQYAVVKAQKIIFAEDLEKTFSAFMIATSLYFLTQFMTPFGITILALTTVYIIPLVRSPHGRGIARDGIARAQELGNVAIDQASTLAQDSKVAVSNITSRAQDTASNLTSRAQDTASNLTSRAQDTASNLTSRAQDTTSSFTSSAQDTASNLRQRAVNMVPGIMKSNNQTQSQNASDITSSVPHSSSEPTQARDVSSKYPKDDMSFNESKEMAAKAAHDMSHSFEKSPKSSFNTSDKTTHATGVSQTAVQGFPEPSKHTSSSHGHSDDFGAVTSNRSQGSASLTGNVGNLPSFTGSNVAGNQAPAGKRPSIDDGNYSIQNRTDQGSDYQRSVPREASNRGNLSTGADSSMGRMPLGELIDEKNRAGNKAPPLSAGGLNSMR